MASLKAPKFSGGKISIPSNKVGSSSGGRSLQDLIMIQMLKNQMDQSMKQTAPDALEKDSIATKSQGGSVTYESPAASAKVKQAETLGQRSAETAPSRSLMRGTLIRAKQLTDTVPPPPPGIGRLIKGAQNQWKGEVTQEIPQIKEFHNQIDSTLTAFARTMFAEKGNVANWDIHRVKKAFSDISWDTADARALGWNRAIDTYNDVISQYSSLQNERIDKRQLLSPTEIGRARFLSGYNEYSDLTDLEMEGVFDGPVNEKIMAKPYIEKAVAEYEKRGLHIKAKGRV